MKSETDPRLHQVPVLIASNTDRRRRRLPKPSRRARSIACRRCCCDWIGQPTADRYMNYRERRNAASAEDADAAARRSRDPEPAVLEQAAVGFSAAARQRITPRRTCWRRAVPAPRGPASACGPVASTVIEVPMAAPSIIRPMIEVAGTDMPSRLTVMSASKPSAHLTNLAEARACRPRWLMIASSRAATVADTRQSPRIWLATLMYLRPASCAAVAALSSA